MGVPLFAMAIFAENGIVVTGCVVQGELAVYCLRRMQEALNAGSV